MVEELPRLTSAEAAARLGVQPQTLYAYVSRGLLHRERTAAGSTFDALEIEEFAARRRPMPERPLTAGTPLMVLDTDIALIEDGRLYFRGLPATQLAREHGFEAVARWLWGGELAPGAFPAVPGAASVAGAPLDLVIAAVAQLAASDPLRHDVSAESVRMAAPRLIAAAASAVAGAADGSTAARLWAGLAARPRDDAAERVLDQALVLLVDHDLAVSTLAVRAAASARASVHAAVLSGLGALDSALHGNASAAAARLILRAVETGDADLAIAESVSATGRAAPGFGHVVYRDADPRAEFLLDALQGYAPAASVLDAVTALRTAVRVRTGRQPNVDLALGALVVASGMPLDAGPALFAIARMAGWIAHALDEYERPPLRLRPRGRYVGPPPSGLA